MTLLEVVGVILFLFADGVVGYAYFRWMRRGNLG